MVDWTPRDLAQWMPYLHAHPARVARCRRELGETGGLRIGLAWRGTQLWRRDPSRYRSIRLAELAPLARIPGVELASLQFGAGAEEPSAAGFPIRELDTAGMDATAAAIEALDLVVAIDSAVAHLACALGKPCFVLLPSAADWRWMNHPTLYPFYPSARLFRQPTPGDWRSVAAAVARAVSEMARQSAGSAQRSAGQGA
jgi:hypothetical protein